MITMVRISMCGGPAPRQLCKVDGSEHSQSGSLVLGVRMRGSSEAVGEGAGTQTASCAAVPEPHCLCDSAPPLTAVSLPLCPVRCSPVNTLRKVNQIARCR